MIDQFSCSKSLVKRLREVIPGGAHTYAKGEDQYPEGMAPVIRRGLGSHVWDVDGNEFIEYGAGARAVTLGHAYPAVIRAAQEYLPLGANFIRPSEIELKCAERLLEFLPGMDMAKFCKDGSDATSGAVKLARAHTGRDLIAICGDQPFFSVDDWFIGATGMPGGIPKAVRELTVKFPYNDVAALDRLFSEHAGRIAGVILEAEKETPPLPGYLEAVRAVCHKNGAVFILDEMITGFRWSNGGAQQYFNVRPDLATFGKAMGNGFSVSALVGRRELMELGGMDHTRERVFLLSTTHGAETHGLAAALATMETYASEPVIETLWKRGSELKAGLLAAAEAAGVSEYVPIRGQPCCLVFGSLDADRKPSQGFRTLLLQEIIARGILATSLVVSYSHSSEDIEKTVEAFSGAFAVYRQALDSGLDPFLKGRWVKPALRPFA